MGQVPLSFDDANLSLFFNSAKFFDFFEEIFSIFIRFFPKSAIERLNFVPLNTKFFQLCQS